MISTNKVCIKSAGTEKGGSQGRREKTKARMEYLN